MCPTCWGQLHPARNRGRPPARAPGPQVVLGRSASVGLGDQLGSVVHRKPGSRLGGREGFQFPGQEPRDPVNLASFLKGGARAPRDACPGGAFPGPSRPRVLARNQPYAAQTKAISWGPPRCSSIRKGGPLYGWKNRGIFAVAGTGRRGLRVCRHVGQLLAPRPHACELHGGGGPLMAGCRLLRARQES